ncbi:MAG: oligopeptide/dipeptide ABC transporter ATP-binding protein [Mesorhizobium sp.]
MTAPIISISALSKRFSRPLDLAERFANLFGAGRQERVVHALDNIDLDIRPGEIVGLVGESGCGKSTLGRIVAGINPPTAGSVSFAGKDLATMPASERLSANLAVQMVFQDPMASLNPRLRVLDILTEAPVHHGIVARRDAQALAAQMLRRVGLDPSMMWRYPHQFSGGQRARIGIARALCVNPKVLVCDESTAALDVSIQAQVINLFMKLRDELDLTYLFVSHDLSVVHHISDRIAVMYLGRIVELGEASTLFENPSHPYTRALIAESPRVTQGRRAFTTIKGEIPSPLNPPSGCHFHPRCPLAMPRCKVEVPALKRLDTGTVSACHFN